MSVNLTLALPKILGLFLGFLSWAQPHQPIFGDLFVQVCLNHFPSLLPSSYSRHIPALLQEGD